MKSYIQHAFNESYQLLNRVLADSQLQQQIANAVDLCVKCYQHQGKIISCGNGGSLCDAAHFAEELTGRFKADRPSLAAMAINDGGHISCVGNDYGYDYIFSRYVEGCARPEDLLLGISTSGNSKNVINAVKTAKQLGIPTIALLGKDGGELKDLADIPIVIPSHSTERVQEIHIKIIHIMIEGIERALFPDNYTK